MVLYAMVKMLGERVCCYATDDQGGFFKKISVVIAVLNFCWCMLC